MIFYAEIKGILRYIGHQSLVTRGCTWKDGGYKAVMGNVLEWEVWGLSVYCIISWNFKHIVNVKIIRGVRAITNLEGYKMIEIWNPSVLLESEE